jgi:hypothetical protein
MSKHRDARDHRRRLAELFARLRSTVVAQGTADPEPDPRFTPEWTAWNVRDVARRYRLSELAEAEALTVDPSDPAPIASMGWATFHEWAARQERRRRARRAS